MIREYRLRRAERRREGLIQRIATIQALIRLTDEIMPSWCTRLIEARTELGETEKLIEQLTRRST